MTKVCYIIACWSGKRRGSSFVTGVPLLTEHLSRFSSLSTNIGKIYVVFPPQLCDSNEVLECVAKFKTLNIEVIFRDNNDGFSYGSWDECLRKTAHEYDYSFLIEDDYCPVVDYFENVFLKQYTENTGYVCQLAFSERGANVAAISHGVIRNSIFREYGFNILDGHGYGNAEDCQRHFLDNITNAGYDIRDIAGEHRIRFNRKGLIEELGTPAGSEVVSPII